MLRTLACSTGIALVLSANAMAQGHDHDHDSVTLYRVFVGDHAEGRVTAFDLGEPGNRWTFETTGQPKLYGVNDGAAVVAVQSDDARCSSSPAASRFTPTETIPTSRSPIRKRWTAP